MSRVTCGHGSEVSYGRCWDCHLAHLRDTGQGARADRLIEHKRQQDEGRVDFKRLVDGLAEMYAEQLVTEADEDLDRTRRPPEVRPLRHGRPGL